MTYTAIIAAAKTGLTSQSRLPVKKALAVAPALKLVSAIACSQPLPHLKQPNASSVRCPHPAASISSQRKVSPSAVVVPSARQTESIAKHLKRSQSVSKAHPVAVQQRLKPSHPTSVNPSLHSRSLLPSQKALSMSARKADSTTVDQVLEAFSRLRLSSPVSTIPILPGSRIPRRAATRTQKPTTRPVLRSCFAKKNVVLSTTQLSQSCRPLKRVRFGTSSTCTFPKVQVFFTEMPKVKYRYPSRLKEGTILSNGWIHPTGWVRLDDPVETPKPRGATIVDETCCPKLVGDYRNCACQLSCYCKGYCRDLADRGSFKMPAYYTKHDDPPLRYTQPLPRCSRCLLERSALDREDVKMGCHIVMASWADVCKVTKLASTSTILARPRTCECTHGSFNLPANPVDAPYDFDNDPDIF